MLKINNRVKRLAKLIEVPFTNLRLGFIPIPPSVLIGVVADVIRIEVLHPSIRSIIDS